MLDVPYLVINPKSNAVLYEAQSLSQARGFSDACERETQIFSAVELFGITFPHQICLLNVKTGEILARGPVVDMDCAPDAMHSVRIALLPVLDGAAIEGAPQC